MLLLMDDGPTPTFDATFLSGVLPPGLTYTNSSTTRTYFGADGLLKTAAANAPIFEYNPVTMALLGMRWEMEQRTNLALYSTLPGGGAAPTGWTQPIATGTSSPTASIYGAADGSVAYTQTATAQRPLIESATVALSANTTYTLSMIVESVSGALTAIDVLRFNGTISGATITHPACAANPAGISTGAVQTGELLVRIAVGATAGSLPARCGIGCNGNATGTLQFSRPQFEAGASRSSFIPTAAAAVTRQPDVLAASSISWYRQDEGTVLFEGIASYFTASLMGTFAFSAGNDTNRITQYLEGSGRIAALNTTAGVNVDTSETANGATAGSVFRSAHAYKTNNFGTVLNGSSVVTDTSGVPATVNQLRLGGRTFAGASPFMGYARRFQYYNTRLPNGQIQGMSRV